MKFSLISTFTLVGAIVASPLGLTEKRDSSVVGTIASVVTNVQNVVTGSTANIGKFHWELRDFRGNMPIDAQG